MATLVLLLSACSPRMLIIQGVADELASQGAAPEEDLLLARDAGAFYLKLSESLLREQPGNLKLAEAVAGGFTQYAYAFVAFEADRMEAKDSKAAHRLRERAARLYRRAQRHAMAALEAQSPGIGKALAEMQGAAEPRQDQGGTQPAAGGPSDEARPRLRPGQVGVAYWGAAAWGGLISLSKDDPDVVADLPLAIRLAQIAWETAPEHGEGAVASLMGTFESARPGGSAPRAAAYFAQAVDAGKSANAGVYVAMAESIALLANDRTSFEALLRQALDIAAKRRDLQNSVMRERAQWLLDTAEDRF